MKILKAILMLLITVALTSFTLVQYQAYQYQLTQQQDELAVVSREAVLQKIQSLNNLETIAFNIDVVISNSKEGNWYKLWQDQHKSIYIARGSVRAGVDLNKLTADNISTDEAGKSRHIQLPAAQIFNVYLDDIELYDSKTGVLAKSVEKEVLTKVQQEGKLQIYKKACASDVLTLANTAAQKQIQALFTMADTPIEVSKSKTQGCDGTKVP